MRTARGFTLLELLLATVLSVMLMLGVLAVLTDLSSDPDTVATRDAKTTALQTRAIDAWVTVLRGDLSHAIQIDADGENRLTLVGSGALDARGRERTHRPVLVTYSLETLAGRRWLVRKQALQDALTADNTQRDLVCSGVQRFELAPQGGPSAVAGSAAGPLANPLATPGSGRGDAPDPSEKPDEASDEHDDEPIAEPEGMREDYSGDFDKPEQLVFGRKAGFDTVFNKTTGKTSIYVNGLWYYPRYAPKWARNKYYKAVNPSRLAKDAGDDGPSSGAGDAQGSQGQGGQDDSAHEAGPAVSSVGVTWRLRVWTDDGDRPTHDRIVTVQLTGGG
jgi:hypothetical protein